ncbi:MAG: hypothetical protein PHH64_02515 [Proteiniphilum sp.]|nr:hypothetical protein [Proteiniphilum sp.]MDD4158266.1 hypothetical protein [Proteiniphilum sp.]MDD4800983.1 hypothetical protein [Proteiniphilum sp.]
MRIRKMVTACLLLMMAVSCGEEPLRNTLPFAPASFRVDLNGVEHDLWNPLAYKMFTEENRRFASDRFGYAGLLVVAGADGTLYAYDLCCPHEDSKNVVVVPEANGKARCPSCGSLYVTLYGLGSLESGPGKESLQRYRVVPLPDGSCRIVVLDRICQAACHAILAGRVLR